MFVNKKKFHTIDSNKHARGMFRFKKYILSTRTMSHNIVKLIIYLNQVDVT